MKTLTFDELIELLKSNNACAEQLNPILENGTLDFAHKVMRGNRGWVRQHFGTDFDDILNDGEALIFHSNGQISWCGNYKNSNLEGLYEFWHDNGQLSERRNYKNGIQEGLY